MRRSHRRSHGQSRRRSHRLLAAAAAAGILIGATPGVASAARWHASDPRGDASATRYDDEPAPCGTVTELDGTAETSVDITRLAVVHERDTVRLTVRFRDLVRGDDQYTTFYVDAPKRDFDIDLFPFGRRGSVETILIPAPEPPDEADLDECGAYSYAALGRRCHGLSGRIARARATVTVDVPRRCLGNPRWVRVGVSSSRWVDATGTSYLDEWGHRDAEDDAWNPVYGPRVRRG